MTELAFDHDPNRLPPGTPDRLPVLMYGRRPPRGNSASIGGPVIDAVRRLGTLVHPVAFDLLTVAMAVTAADTFVDRKTASDGWCREFRIRLPLADPGPWGTALPKLQSALHFLSGDTWSFELLPGGPERPIPQIRGHLTVLDGHDCASLFSGGLDSTIGVLDLLRGHRTPVLISHSYRGDAVRQKAIQEALPRTLSRFAAIANPVSALMEADPGDLRLRLNDVGMRRRTNDVQMRTRSFGFLAYGALVAATMARSGAHAGSVELHVPENGFIALNPPLTPRRLGSLSTRTTHPHFLGLMRQIFEDLAIPVALVTSPYDEKTKGAMMADCRDRRTLASVAATTVSCGKWKRTGMQCGRCVPCLIRRAAFHTAGMQDRTPYDPDGLDLRAVLGDEKKGDDLLALMLALDELPGRSLGGWVSHSGPLPVDRDKRDRLTAVASDGMAEVAAFLHHVGVRP